MNNLTIRVLTAIIGIPIIILVSIYGGIYFLLFILISSLLAQREFYKLIQLKGAKPLTSFGLISGLVIVLSFFFNKIKNFIVESFEYFGIHIPFPSQTQLFLIITIMIIIIVLIWEMFRNNGSAFQNISATLMGIFYIPLFFGTLVGLRELFVPFDFPVYQYFPNDVNLSTEVIEKIYLWGGYTIITIFAIIWICDTAAYFGGKLIGRNKLFERISPNKTWEGAVIGFLFAILTAVLAKYLFLGYMSITNAVVIGFIVGIFGQIGDLAESLLKRDAGVKDSSNLIPGHGGVLDRFDSLLFVSPIVYLYIDFFVFS